MPSSLLHRLCDSLAHSVFLRAGFFQPMRFFLPFSSSPPPTLPLGFAFFMLLLFSFFSTSMTGACSLPFVQGSWLGCTVVSVMGALFQSRGWLPIEEAPRYSRHPTSILAMQLKLHFILSISNITVNVKTQRPGLLVR